MDFCLCLSRATHERSYLEKAEMMYKNFFLTSSWAFSWDDKTAGVQLLLYGITKKTTYSQAFQKYLRNWLPGKTNARLISKAIPKIMEGVTKDVIQVFLRSL